MSLPARVPLWLKTLAGQKGGLGRKAGAREAWRVIREAFPGGDVATILRDGQEILQVRMPVGAVDWIRVELFRSTFGLEIRTNLFEGEKGPGWILTFAQEKSDGENA